MRIAALDLGSNSFHLLVADAHPDGDIVPVVRQKEVLRLGDRVSRHGRIGPRAATRAVAVVDRFRLLAEAANCEALAACATSAIREAADGQAHVARLGDEAGVPVRVVAADEEARLVFTAVRASVVLEPAPAVALDLGGGSLEITVGDAHGVWCCTSVPLGIARLSAELVRSDPPTADDLRRLRERAVSVLTPVAAIVAAHQPGLGVATGGAVGDLARLAAARRHGAVPLSVNQLVIGRDELRDLHDELVAVTARRRARLPGLDPRRADLLPAAVTVLTVAVEVLGLAGLTVSEWGLREGIVLDALGFTDHPARRGVATVPRRASALALARRWATDERHAAQVARLAVTLFDGTAEVHGLGPADRELLELGALLHDVGAHVSADDHHKHGAYLVLHGRLRGFDPEEVQALAALVRHHRAGEPKRSHQPFGSLPAPLAERVLTLAGLLRVADGLDRGHQGAVRGIDIEVDDDRVRVQVRARRRPAELEWWGAERKRALLEARLGRRLELVDSERPERSKGSRAVHRTFTRA
jgi:exopolyphosphatase/guanosine-5'-triphosphate,3'-diphosphate pyrophosphatase